MKDIAFQLLLNFKDHFNTTRRFASSYMEAENSGREARVGPRQWIMEISHFPITPWSYPLSYKGTNKYLLLQCSFTCVSALCSTVKKWNFQVFSSCCLTPYSLTWHWRKKVSDI